MLVAAPLASYMPLGALAGILAVVAWNMAERHEFVAILRRSRGEALVLLATFLLTVFRDLTEGIAVGVVLGSLLFMHRMARARRRRRRRASRRGGQGRYGSPSRRLRGPRGRRDRRDGLPHRRAAVLRRGRQHRDRARAHRAVSRRP
jgi:MFS superfamily sulfate permease-like transporter